MASSSTTPSSASAPFWGAYTALAPFGPSSGLSTSQASWKCAPRAAGCRPLTSTRAACRSAAPPGATSFSSASRMRTPSACSIPAPPSVDALPPTPTMISRAPSSSACLMTVPSPNVLAPSGSSAPTGRVTSPTAEASSTTAVDPRTAYKVAMGRPVGPVVFTATGIQPAATAAATVPSPPSATGAHVMCQDGFPAASPSARASATSAAVREPLNLSGASNTCMTVSASVQHRDDGGGGVLRGQREFLELHHVVDLGAHGDVGDPLEDDFHQHRNAVFHDELLRRFQRRQDLVRVLHPQGLATQRFRELEVVDAVTRDLLVGRGVDVVECQLDAVVHVEATLGLPDQAEVGVVHQHVDVGQVELGADGKFFHHELEIIVAGEGDHGSVRVGGAHPEGGGHRPAQRAGLPCVDPVSRLVHVQELGGRDLRQSDGRHVPGVPAEGLVHLLAHPLRLDRNVVEVGAPVHGALAFLARLHPVGPVRKLPRVAAFPRNGH